MSRTPSILALLLALVTCALLGVLIAVEVRRATPDATPAARIAAAARERAAAREASYANRDRRWKEAFATGMVKDRVVWGSPPTTDVAFVNATPGADLAASARACAKRYRSTRVTCYAFAGTEAYEYRNISGEMKSAAPSALVNLCWAVRAATTTPGGAIQISDLRDAPAFWDQQQCPSSWTGTQRSAAGS